MSLLTGFFPCVQPCLWQKGLFITSLPVISEGCICNINSSLEMIWLSLYLSLARIYTPVPTTVNNSMWQQGPVTKQNNFLPGSLLTPQFSKEHWFNRSDQILPCHYSNLIYFVFTHLYELHYTLFLWSLAKLWTIGILRSSACFSSTEFWTRGDFGTNIKATLYLISWQSRETPFSVYTS